MSGCGRNNTDFAEDRISIVLTQAAKYSGKVYTIDDFPEIELLRIEPTSDAADNRQFTLYLKNSSKQNVLNAIDLLSKRDDIQSTHLCYDSGAFPV